MTLKTRNKIFLVFISIFSVVFLLDLTLFTIKAFKGSIVFLDNNFSNKIVNFLFSPVNGAGIISSIILCCFATIASFLISQVFEKTHASEIIYFAEFLLGILLVSFKLYVLLFSLEKTYSFVLLIIQRCAFAGQILCVISFLVSSLFNDEDQLQNTEKNFSIILAASIIISSATPVNMHTIRLSGLADIGFKTSFFVVVIILMIITVISFALCWYERDEKHYLKSSFAFILIMCGSFCLFYSINYFFLFLGTCILAIGTKMYISMLHKYYLWK